MNRTYDKDRFLGIVHRLRANIPNICLSSDVIVGFPTETDEDFRGTLAVLREARFDSVYAFKYSPRRGTVAADMDGQIDRAIADKRLAELLAVQDEISLEINSKYMNSEHTVLVDAMSKRGDTATVSARTEGNKLVHFVARKAKVGEFCRVKITEAGAYDLFAEEI